MRGEQCVVWSKTAVKFVIPVGERATERLASEQASCTDELDWLDVGAALCCGCQDNRRRAFKRKRPFRGLMFMPTLETKYRSIVCSPNSRHRDGKRWPMNTIHIFYSPKSVAHNMNTQLK